MEKKTKKKIFTVMTLSMILWIYSHDHKYSSNYEVLDDIAYARYENGNIYIGNEEYINSLTDISEDDILVVD